MRKNYPVYYLDLRDSLDLIANKLLYAKKSGNGLYCDLSGLAILGAPNGVSMTKVICSDDVNSVDDVYKAVTGLSVEEYNNRMKAIREEATLSLKENRDKMMQLDNKIILLLPEISSHGLSLIIPSRSEEWKSMIETNSRSELGRLYLYSVYQVLMSLSQGKSIEEVKKEYDDLALDGVAATRVKEAIFKFSPRGLEFYKAVSTKKELLMKFKKIVERTTEDNKRKKGVGLK